MVRIPVARQLLIPQLLLGLSWLFVTVVGIGLHPNPIGHATHVQLGLGPCPSSFFFERPCPACGLTTSFSALLHGDFGLAFRAHALGPIAYLVFTGFGLTALVGWLAGYKVYLMPVQHRWLVSGVALFATYGIVRMLLVSHYVTDVSPNYFVNQALSRAVHTHSP